MNLTDKAKKDFDNYCADLPNFQRQFIELHLICGNLLVVFNNLPDELKFGMFQRFFDSVKLIIGIEPTQGKFELFINNKFIHSFNSRSEAQSTAIDLINKRYNKYY